MEMTKEHISGYFYYDTSPDNGWHWQGRANVTYSNLIVVAWCSSPVSLPSPGIHRHHKKGTVLFGISTLNTR